MSVLTEPRTRRQVAIIVTAVVIAFLLLEVVIRWLPPDRVVATTQWTHDLCSSQAVGPTTCVTRHDQHTAVYTAAKDASAIQHIYSAFSSNDIALPPTISGCHVEPDVYYGGERYTVTFYWHGLPTQVWSSAHGENCGYWFRSSGGAPDLWAHSLTYIPFHFTAA